MKHEADYLIIGAGAMGLAFADELLTRTDATMVIADTRAAPGGHWNDAYSFVKLHQPSIFYGVESTPLGRDRVETSGPNEGFLELAEGPEILAYFHALMRDRLLPSGRVTFLPLTRAAPDGSLRHVLSGETGRVTVRRKVVDASWYTNPVPATHTPKFEIADGAHVRPPNDLPRRAARFDRFTVIGAGKTGVDSCVWLLENGVAPDRIRWIAPRDPWFLNRRYTQPGDAFFESTFAASANQRRAMAEARDPDDLARRMEACGAWLRLDPQIQPTLFHAATVSEGELALLREIGDTVRLGRVTRVEAERLVLEHGTLAGARDTLHVDCTATALPVRALKPVFDGDRITLQMTRFPMLPFSAAIAAFLEATFKTDSEKNAFTKPLPLTDTLEDYVRGLPGDMANRYACSKDAVVRAWVANSRLDGYTRIVRDLDPSDAPRQAIIRELADASKAAAANLPRLLSALTPPAP
jgi:cation diffusion facilitator CzcD-associated flavoprotein CzcO